MSQITIVALVLFAITYVLMLVFQKIRPYIVGVSALVLYASFPLLSTISPIQQQCSQSSRLLPRVSRTVRFTEPLFEKLNKTAAENNISFFLLVLQCCKYALENQEKED